MKSLESTKYGYLIEESLENLHHQSMEWMADIEFWQDEMAFFYNVIDKKTAGNDYSRSLQDKLVALSTEEIRNLRTAIIVHERKLSEGLQEEMPDMQHYRNRHVDLAGDVDKFATALKELKKQIFSEVKAFKK